MRPPMITSAQIMNSFERRWRQLGTGLSFALFGLGGLALTVTIFPALNLLIQDRAKRSAVAQRVVHSAWRVFVSTMVALRVIDFEVEGADLLRDAEGTLVISNHPSLIDVVLIMSLM